MSFAKLFESDKAGQILVKKDSDEDGAPEIRFYFEPEGMGVCSVALGYSDSDDGWDKCEETFDEKVDLSLSEKLVLGAMEHLD